MKQDSILKQFFIMGSGAIINMVIGFLTTPIITRIVIPEEYGQMSMFTTYSNIAMMILCLGLDQALLRYFYKSENLIYRKKMLFICWIYPVILSIIVLLCAVIVFKVCNISYYIIDRTIVILFALNVICMLFNRFSTLILRMYNMSKKYSYVSIIHKSLYVVIILGLAAFMKSNYFFIMAFASVSSYFITNIIAILWKWDVWLPSLQITEEKVEIFPMIRYGLPLMIASGIYLFFQAIDKISLNFFCSYHDVGIYSSAMSLMSLMSIVTNTFNVVWMPEAMKHYEKNKDDREFYVKGNSYITVVAFFVGLTLILCKDLVALLLGSKYREAAMLLPMLLFHPIMYTVSETTVVGIYFKQKSYAQLITCIISCICNIIGNIIMIPLIGPKGAAISTCISYIIFFGLRTWFSNKYYYIDFSLKKFYSITIVSVLYALYNTFIQFNALHIIIYLIVMIIFFSMYRDTIKEMVIYLIVKLKR